MPAVARAESEYVLKDGASTPLRSMRGEARKTKTEFIETSKALDRIGTGQQLQRLDRLMTRMDRLGAASERMHTRVDRSVRKMSSTIDRNVNHSSASVDRLRGDLERLGRTDARPRVHLDGVAQSRAELAALRSELRAYGRESVAARVRVVPGGGGGLGGRPRGGAFAGTGGVGGFTSRRGLIAGAAVGALPIVQSLGGAAGAIAGSGAGAALGLGSVYAAGLGAAGAGLAAIAAVAIPAKKGLEVAKKAQDKYNAAVADFGRTSKQATTAKHEMDQAFAHAPRGARELLEQTRALSREWDKLTRGSQGDLLGLGATFAGGTRRAAPQLARDTRIVTRSTKRAGEDFAGFLGSNTVQRAALEMSELYAKNIGTAERTGENLVRTFINIARASKPFFTEAVDWTEHWSKGWSDSTRDIDHTRGRIGGFVDDLKAWGHLAKEATTLTWHLLNMGRPAGRGGIVELTSTLDRWDSWVQDNPEKVDRFFRDSITSTGKLAGGLVQVVKALHEMADMLRPLADRFSEILTLAGKLGLLQPGAFGVALGAYRGVRGGGRGGAGGAGGGVIPLGGGGGRGGGAPRSLPYSGGLTGAYETYGIQRALGATRTGAAGMAGGRLLGSTGLAGGLARGGVGALRGAGRAFLPISLGLGVLDFASAQGNFGERLGSAANAGLLGIPNALGLGLGRGFKPTGQERADTFLNSNAGNAGAIGGQMAHLRRMLGASEQYQRSQGVGGRGAAVVAAGIGTRQLLRGDERKNVQNEIRALQPAFNQADAGAGQAGAQDIQSAFGIRQKASGTGAARRGFGTDFANAFRERGREGRRELATQVGGWIDELQKGDKSSRRTADRMARSVVDKFRRMGADVRTVNEAIGSQTPRTWNQIASALGTASERALQAVHQNFTAIQQEAIGSLTAMGYSRGEAIGIVRSQEASNAAAGAKTRRGAIGSAINAATGTSGAMSGGVGGYTGSAAPSGGKARGGRIRGQGLSDTVPFGNATVAPGEAWIANRHTEDRLNVMLRSYGTSLGREIERESKPHGSPRLQLARGGAFRPGDAGGAWVTGDTDFRPEVMTALTRMAQARRQHIYVQSGGRSAAEQAGLIKKYGANNPSHPVAGLNGPHVQGIAADITPGRDVFGSVASRFGLGFTVPQEPWHVQLLGGGGAGGAVGAGNGSSGLGAQTIQLRRRRSGLSGVPGALADRASNAYRTGLERSINNQLGGAAGGASAPGQVRDWVIAGLRLAGIPATPANIAAQLRLTMGESGGNPSIRQKIKDINSSNGSGGAIGVTQMLQSTFDAHAVPGHTNILNPIDNEASSALYQMARYGRLVGHPGYKRGGKVSGVPMLGSGGSVTARRPTLIGVGDNPGGTGPGEDVSVRRRKNGPGRRRRNLSGGVSIIIEHMPITYSAKGDVRKVVRDELRQAIEDLTDELENGVDEDEAVTLG